MVRKLAVWVIGSAMLIGASIMASADTVEYDLGSGGYLPETVLWTGDVLYVKGAQSENISSGANTYQGCTICDTKHRSHNISEGIVLENSNGSFSTTTKEISMIVEKNGAYVTETETVECEGTVIDGPVLVYGKSGAKFTQTDQKCEHGSIVNTYYYTTGYPVVVEKLGSNAIPVQYDYNGGVLRSEDTNPRSLPFSKEAYQKKLVMPVKIGYSCSFTPSNASYAWYDYSEKAIMVSKLNGITFSSAQSTLEDGVLTFTAKWEAEDMNITFVNEGCENAADLDGQNVFRANVSRELKAPELEGYELEGFYAGTTKITNLDQIPIDMWNAENEYTIVVKWKKNAEDNDTTPGGNSGSSTTPGENDDISTPAPNQPAPSEPSVPNGLNVGKTEVVKGVSYTAVSANEVRVKQISKKAKTVKIPDTVKINGKSYKVTAIGNNAFKGCSKLKSAVLGKSIKSIGKNAFYGCTSLKKLKIQSTGIKTVGKKAFKKCGAKGGAKLKVDVPNSKVKAYKKLFVKKGLSKKAKVK